VGLSSANSAEKGIRWQVTGHVFLEMIHVVQTKVSLRESVVLMTAISGQAITLNSPMGLLDAIKVKEMPLRS